MLSIQVLMLAGRRSQEEVYSMLSILLMHLMLLLYAAGTTINEKKGKVSSHSLHLKTLHILYSHLYVILAYLR